MELKPGIDIHFIETKKFKTSHIKWRFSTFVVDESLVARRAIVAQMLASSCEKYETSLLLRRKLSSLYGANLSTDVSIKGCTHCLDIELSFLNDKEIPETENILESILDILDDIIFRPLSEVERFHKKTFEAEKINLINNLKADEEDPFYISDLKLREQFFLFDYKQMSKYGTVDLLSKEDAYTAYQEWRRMLEKDAIDIFVVGDVERYPLLRRFATYSLEERFPPLLFEHDQNRRTIVHGKIERRPNAQSVLELGYLLPTYYGDDNFAAFLVFNGLFVSNSHSRLFMKIREQEGLAYTISSQYDSYSYFYKIYAGIDAANRQKVLKLVNKEFLNLRLGCFSEYELAVTKNMLKNNLRLLEDSPQALMEKVYNQFRFAEINITTQNWERQIDEVSKSDVTALAKEIRLQAIYFMEGVG